MSELTPGFMVIHGNQLEELRELIVQWMSANPLHPLENEIILVQSNGIAQWLKLALAADEGGGICAATQVELPARFLWRTYRTVLGTENVAKESPLDKAPLTWRLMRLLPEIINRPEFEPLQRFLEDDADLRKRYQLSERLADLFDQYQVYRADWLQDWAQGKDQLINVHGQVKAVESTEQSSLAWQASLWRILIEDLGQQTLLESRAGVHPRFMQAMRASTQMPKGLPRRVIVFGISSLPAQMLEALSALAQYSQVMLCVNNPCQYHWGDIVEDKDLLRHQFKRHARKKGMPIAIADEDMHQHAHPLLAAWGKQGRDYINLLDQYDDPAYYQTRFNALNQRIDLFDSRGQQRLLNQLQDDILNLRSLQETQNTWAPIDTEHDQSIRFHVAHSAQREVEILHDQLLARFAQDSSLKPRDIIVMVPDVNRYAAHIQAVFGQHKRDDKRAIPFTLSDQGQRGTDPLLIALEHLLHLPETRSSVSDLMDLLDVPAVRGRFNIAEEDLPQLQNWITGSGIRWGLNAEQRQKLGQTTGLEQNTWSFGLRRMLLGYALGARGEYQGIEPYDEIAGLEAAIIGPLVQLLTAIEQLQQQLEQTHSLTQWVAIFQQLLQDFFSADNERDELLLLRLETAYEAWFQLAEAAQITQPLPLAVAREAWLSQLEQDRLSQRFLAGAVNFCTLMPMRAIPFRLVCILGMNDGDYPRSPTPLDFDLMAKDYRPGDRSRREDDRYLLLEALLAATEQIYISWVGRNIRDNSERPASVLINQLREHLAQGWKSQKGIPLLEAITLEHPLQPFSRQYFSEHPQLFTYAQEWASLHQPKPTAVKAECLDQLPVNIELTPDSLVAMLRDPVRYFFNQRLKVYFNQDSQEQLDIEPFAVDALAKHRLAEELLNAACTGPVEHIKQRLEAQAQIQQRSGFYPMNGFGEHLQQQLLAPLENQATQLFALQALWPNLVTSAKPLTFNYQQYRLEGWFSGLRQNQQGALANIERITGRIYSGKQLKWHRILRPYVYHVLACACDLPVTTFIISEEAQHKIPALDAESAKQLVQSWISSWQASLQQPLPVAMKTALSYLYSIEHADDQEKALETAASTYEGGHQKTGERKQSFYLTRQYPEFSSFPTADFTHWAKTLYSPLINASISPLNSAEE
ncbi:exodeoxyribonuclease V subunit gamma [Pseudomonas sp. F1_0610]|uniref:exodeoxyribonuclease V subunit gamma n=1 Tax=Pseudomonas sp. F1_0610 TaxID=3114284 RepID=UPI0039C1DD76